MTSSQLIGIMIGLCILYCFMVIFSKPFKMVGKLILRGIISMVGIFVLDFILSPWSIAVGINPFTACIGSILGIPGIASLYALMWFLG